MMTVRITPSPCRGAFLVECVDQHRRFEFSGHVTDWDGFLRHEAQAKEAYERHTQAIERERLGAIA